MKRAILALGLTVLLLAMGSSQVPTVEPPWVAFSCRSSAEGCGPTSISQQVQIASHRGMPQEAPIVDHHTIMVLEKGVLAILHQGEEVWTSDPSWDVRQVVAADLNHDEQQEVALVLWKPFHREPDIVYQTFRFPSPWEEGSQRNHLFVYAWEEGRWQPMWCSSPIPDPVVQIAAGDVDGDGAYELVALESSYGEDPGAPARHVSVWRWNGWGFTLQWRSPLGLYEDLTLFDVTGDRVPEILVQDATRV